MNVEWGDFSYNNPFFDMGNVSFAFTKIVIKLFTNAKIFLCLFAEYCKLKKQNPKCYVS